MPRATVVLNDETFPSMEGAKIELRGLGARLGLLSKLLEKDGYHSEEFFRQCCFLAKDLLGKFTYNAQRHNDNLKETLAKIGVLFED